MISLQTLFLVFTLRGLATCPLMRNEVDLLNRPTCGLATRAVQYDDHDRRISEGDPAAAGQFPWYAEMIIDDHLEKRVHQCGASILTPRVLLTAAHCLLGLEDDFRRGKVDYRVGSNLAFFGEAMIPADYRIHPQFTPAFNRTVPQTSEHPDIALVFLRDPIPHLDHPLGPPLSREEHRYRPNAVCLPQDGQDFGDYVSYQLCGLGATYDGSPTPDVLQWATLHTPSPGARENGFNCTESFLPYGCYPDRQIMTFDNDNKRTESCPGDSGGPLVRMNPPQPRDTLPQRATLAGVVSFGGPKCGRRRNWSIYARVAHYTPWIRQEIKKYFDKLEG